MQIFRSPDPKTLRNAIKESISLPRPFGMSELLADLGLDNTPSHQKLVGRTLRALDFSTTVRRVNGKPKRIWLESWDF